MPSDPRETPAMRQHARFKARHPDCILLFRMGDFYELFHDDAVVVSKALGLTLTERTKGVPMAGVPHHQLEVYLRRLIERGFRVAVCDQVEDPRLAKGIVARDVTRVLTPGTLVDDALLEDRTPCHVVAVSHPAIAGRVVPDLRVGVAVAELSTGRFTVFDCAASALADELIARGASEVLFPQHGSEAAAIAPVQRAADATGAMCTPRPAWQFRHAEAIDALRAQYGVSSLAGFGLRDDDDALPAAGALVRFLRETQSPSDDGEARALAHLLPPRRESTADTCLLDAVSLRSLEIERTLREPIAGARGRMDGSLVGLFQGGPTGCRTPMGKRLVREWLCRPSAVRAVIEARHACVAALVRDAKAAAALVDAIDGVQDAARIGGRLALGRATPRDLVGLGRSLARLDAIADALADEPALARHAAGLAEVGKDLLPVAQRIARSCVESPPSHLREGGVIADGIDAELDEARVLRTDAGAWLAQYQERLAREHDLPSLRVGFNRVFGYYIALPAAQARRAPDEFRRTQTLKNAERYTTPELKAFEEKVTTAQARAIERERVLFESLCAEAASRLPAIARYADLVAELDVLASFAARARRFGWTRPEMVDEPALRAKDARHPVLEEILGSDLVPNDIDIGPAPSLALITGPNMAGKSTYIRMAALVTLLAHAGSLVPAAEATIGVTDRIFTRIGADDALHAGQSTFMVEMTETANILHNAGPRSLVILDEVGRGTSTLDGLALAWAIAERLSTPGGPRTLFATHYHELTDLPDRAPERMRNLHVAVREWGDQVVFLHRIMPGRTDRSYGLHVARLAGLPPQVVARAGEVLESLEVHAPGVARDTPTRPGEQLSLFTTYLPHPALDRLREVKLDSLTPIQAFDELRRLLGLVEEPDSASP